MRGHGFFVKQLLDPVFQLVWPVTAHVFEPRPIMAERGIGCRRLDQGVVDAVEFEREEQKVRRGGGEPLLYVAVEFGDRGIDGVAGVDESGIGREPAHDIVDRLIAAHRFGERRARRRRARQIGELAFVGLLEGDALGVGAIKIAPYRRIVESRIEVGEIPLRQRPERGLRARRAAARGSSRGNPF